MVEAVTWNARRTGWLGRKDTKRQDPMTPAPSPQTAPTAEAVPPTVVIPPLPSFSPAAIAQILPAPKGTVAYWLDAGKLEFYVDPIGERYVLRAELVRFVTEYLKRPCQS
jgi:hypothetical protein